MPIGRLADRVGRAASWSLGHLALVGAYLCAVAAHLDRRGHRRRRWSLLGTFYAATDGVIAAHRRPAGPGPGARQRHRRRPDRGRRSPGCSPRPGSACCGSLLGPARRMVDRRRAAGASRSSPLAPGCTRLDGAAVTHVSTARTRIARLRRASSWRSLSRRPVVRRRRGARGPRASGPPSPRPSRRRSPTSTDGPRIVFRHTGIDSQYGVVAVVPLDDPSGPRAFTGIACDRVAATARGRLVPGHRPRRRRRRTRAGARRRLAAGRQHRPAGHPEPHPALPRRHARGDDRLRGRPLLHVDRLLHRHRGARRSAAASGGATSRSSSWSSTAARSTPSTATSGASRSSTTTPSTPPSPPAARPGWSRATSPTRTLTAVAERRRVPVAVTGRHPRRLQGRRRPGSAGSCGSSPSWTSRPASARCSRPGPADSTTRSSGSTTTPLLYGMPRADEPGVTDVWAVDATADAAPRLLIEQAWSPTVVR